MKQGVPGFLPGRVTEARDARGLSQVSLAQRMGRNSSTCISRWLRGEQTPETTAVAELSKALNLPTSYFLKPQPEHGAAPFFFRSMVAATKTARNKAKARLRWGQDISLALQEVVDLPQCNVPDPIGERDFRTLEDKTIEEAATACRRAWGLGDGPLSDVHLLLENNGIVIVHDEIGAATMDGVSSWSQVDNRAYIYVAIDKPSAVRTRFNVAHELGHIVLHRRVDQSTLTKPEDFKLIEHQAHLFAAAFLLPAESFAGELTAPTLSAFQALKERWKVAIGAMIKRCDTLGITSDEYTLRLWKHYSARGWRTAEPLDDVIEVEEPRMLSRSIRVLAEQGGWSLPQIVDSLPFAANDIERLGSLPAGFLSAAAAPVIELPRLKSASSPSTGASAQVFDFPYRRSPA
jgi:Zn-dependent peptidase ImmA (M78 family)/transcriptional regulator with XRE-family HTH domain